MDVCMYVNLLQALPTTYSEVDLCPSATFAQFEWSQLLVY